MAQTAQHTTLPWKVFGASSNIMGDLIALTVVDVEGYDIADIPVICLNREWLKQHPGKHWAGGAEASHIERSIGETRATTRFIVTACNAHRDLLAACNNAAASLAICQMPRLDDKVADNGQIIETVLESLRTAIGNAERTP